MSGGHPQPVVHISASVLMVNSRPLCTSAGLTTGKISLYPQLKTGRSRGKPKHVGHHNDLGGIITATLVTS